MSAKGTILVVDNESDQLDMMKKILGRMGYEARITDNPGQALKMVAEQAFQLIIIDLIMPETDGTELCEQIKRVRPSACVYAFSGHVHLYRAFGGAEGDRTPDLMSNPRSDNELIEGVVTARPCDCCGHHEIGIVTASGSYIPLRPGMRVSCRPLLFFWWRGGSNP
jgi:DNA-binding NtrC family response regulator